MFCFRGISHGDCIRNGILDLAHITWPSSIPFLDFVDLVALGHIVLVCELDDLPFTHVQIQALDLIDIAEVDFVPSGATFNRRIAQIWMKVGHYALFPTTVVHDFSVRKAWACERIAASANGNDDGVRRMGN